MLRSAIAIALLVFGLNATALADDNQDEGPIYATITAPPVIIAGESAEYTITIINRSGYSALDVNATLPLPYGYEYIDRDDNAPRTGRVVWQVGTLAAGKTTVIKATLRATRPGTLKLCVDLRYRLHRCVEVVVVQPQLQCQVQAADSVEIDTPFEVTLVATNPGSGVARNVVGRVVLSDNLTPAGETNLDAVAFGDIAAGKSATRTIQVKATAGGAFGVRMHVKGDPRLEHRCADQGQVLVPALQIVKKGPMVRYVGQEAVYSITVKNTGSAMARSVVVRDPLPKGMTLVGSPLRHERVEGAIVWSVGDLAPGKAVVAELTLLATVEGIHENCAFATAIGVEQVRSCVKTRVIAETAMQIQNTDSADPVAIGEETTYRIVVENEGIKKTTQVAITVNLPEQAEFLGAGCDFAKGTYHKDGHKVTFTALPRMLPGTKIVYFVRVKMQKTGDAVCSAELRYAEFDKPILAEEGTKSFDKPSEDDGN